MTDENTVPFPDPQQPGTPEPTAVTEAAPLTPEAQIEALTAEVASVKDRMLRALAEAENTRRRAERDREDMAKYAITNFARGMLNVADNLRRALSSCDETLRADPKVAALMGGVEATERELLSTLERSGVKKIVALDLPFNANFHEVMFEAVVPGKAPGTVFQVIEDGYVIQDRLLRPARVGVVKADNGSAPPTHTIDQQA
jgi:molecular chaperone GrpE